MLYPNPDPDIHQVCIMNSKNPDPDFESALEELESLVSQLEKGELSLDDSLKQFKRGVELTRNCQQILDRAQQTVEQLSITEDESSPDPVEDND